MKKPPANVICLGKPRLIKGTIGIKIKREPNTELKERSWGTHQSGQWDERVKGVHVGASQSKDESALWSAEEPLEEVCRLRAVDLEELRLEDLAEAEERLWDGIGVEGEDG